MAAFLTSVARFGSFLDTVKHKADPGPLTYTAPKHFQAFPAPHVSNRNGSFGLHHDPHYNPCAVTPAVASAAQPPMLSLKEQAPSPWKYSPSVQGQFPHAYTADDIQRVRDEVASAQPISRRKQRISISSLKKEQQRSDEVSLTKLRLALGSGSYEVDKDVNQEKISTNFSFGKERREGLMDHVLARVENGCNPGAMSPLCKTETPTKSSKHTSQTDSERRRYKSRHTSSSMCSSPGLGTYHPDTATAGVLGNGTISEAPFKTKHASGFVLRVRSESELQRQRLDVEKFSKELAKSYKELDASAQKLDQRLSSPNIRAASFQRFEREPSITESYRRGPGSYDHQTTTLRAKSSGGIAVDLQNRSAHLVAKPRSNFGCVKHQDLVKFMVAAGHVNRECLGPDELLEAAVTFTFTNNRETTPDYLAFNKAHHHSGLKKKSKDPSNSEGPEGSAAELSREEMWKVLKNGPRSFATSPNGKLSSRNSTRTSTSNADRRRARSPVGGPAPPSPSDGSQDNQPAAAMSV